MLKNTKKKEIFDKKPLKIKYFILIVIIVAALLGTHIGGWFDPDDMVLVPLTTAQTRLFGTDDLSGINVKTVPSWMSSTGARCSAITA
jgi:hypothetical protein